jgi:hypothetical protein
LSKLSFGFLLLILVQVLFNNIHRERIHILNGFHLIAHGFVGLEQHKIERDQLSLSQTHIENGREWITILRVGSFGSSGSDS